MSNLPVDPYDRTYVLEAPLDNPDRAPLGGTGKDFVVTLTDVHETPGADHMFLSRTGKWVVFGTTELTSWGNIVGDITQQDDLMALLDAKPDTADLAPVAFTGNYNQLINKPPLGTVSPINLDGSTSRFLRGDGNWVIPTDVNATWGNIGGSITAQTDLMAMFDTKANINNPVFTGAPTAPTPPLNDNSTRLATTAWFFGQAFNGVPAMNGVASSGASTLWARGDHVHASDTAKASLAGPAAFTGTTTVPNVTFPNDSTLVANTHYVTQAIAASGGVSPPPSDGNTYGYRNGAWVILDFGTKWDRT